MRYRVITVLALTAVLGACSAPENAAKNPRVLRVVQSASLENLDPIFTAGAVTRAHGYMVYDTLFGTDAKGAVAPQMVETYEVSPDRKKWTFTLRDGLEFHDGAPVTSADAIASLQRWGQRDTMGERLLSFVERWEAVTPKTFVMILKAPYGFVLESLAKPEANVPFIMPKRIADLPATKQLDDPTGSGPFIFKKDEWNPGSLTVYVRNPKYIPRPEAPDGMTGGKVPKMDRIEWVVIKDTLAQASALATGEVDMIISPAYEHYPSFKSNPDIQLFDTNPFIWQFVMAFNHTKPPFDKLEVRRAAMAAMNQLDFLKTQVGIPDMYSTCFSVYPCKTRYATTTGLEMIAHPDSARAREMLKTSGYRGEVVELLQPTEPTSIAKLPNVAGELLTRAGFTVVLRQMDFNTMMQQRTRRDGWSIFLTSWNAANVMNPVVSNLLSGAGSMYNGWYVDAELEKLRAAFVEATQENRPAIAAAVQARAMQMAVFVPLGEYQIVTATRKSVTGLVRASNPVLWNVEKR